jgi:arylsulfatase A-like enzyme
MPVTRRTMLSTSLALLCGRAASRKTNVVMFMTDDHGAWATGAYGCREMHTPNIDRLAEGGARFDRAYACTPVCSPSRATWITGKLPSQHGVQDWLVPVDSYGADSRRFLDGHTTYSEVLAANGYTLGMSGKWHMGNDERAQRGFTFWHTVPGGGGPYRNAEFWTNGERQRLEGFKTDRVGDGALKFLDTVGEKPFYLLMPFYAPHTPYEYQPEEDRAPYENAKFSCFPGDEMHPWQNVGLARHHRNRESMHAYSALITAVDRNVGRVLRKLGEMGVRDNTLVIFTADQGWNAGHHGMWGKGNGTVPLNMYEESIRIPLIWNQPGRIKARAIREMVSAYDYFPTILEYLGVPGPKAAGPLPGRSYRPLLDARSVKWNNRLYFEYEYVRGVRTENLKYIERAGDWPSELFDLERDPGEKKNMIADPGYKEQLASLRVDLHGFFRKQGAPPLENWRSTTRQKLTEYKRARP